MPIDKFNNFRNAIQATLATSNHTLINFRFLRSSNFSFFLQILQNCNNKLNNRNNQRPKSQRTQMVSECTVKASSYFSFGIDSVFSLVKVPNTSGACEDELVQSV